MVEPFADQLKTHTKFCPLDVSEGFSKGMCAVIAFKVYGFAPLLNHAVYGLGFSDLGGLSGLGIFDV